MDLPEIFLIRHGETEWNRVGRWQGDLDSALTDTGRAQAAGIGAALANIGISPRSHEFYSSPIGRARHTMRLVLDGLGHPDAAIIEDARLREISVGGWTGMTRATIRAETGLGEDAHFLDYYAAAPGGEGLDAMQTRAEAFLRTVQTPAVIITHGITLRFLRVAALGLGRDRLADPLAAQGVIHHIVNRQHGEIQP